ncbi:MAG: flagellar protein FlaG [Gammaproteobacteria bacterium]|nr:flagellar protein FlaG [Gammaproteobacteria bacterium]
MSGSDKKTATSGQEARQELPTQAVVAAEKPETEELPEVKVNRIVEDLNHKVQDIRRELRFSYNEESGRTVISVLDSETKEIIRQIPPEEVVALAEHFEDHSGLLMSARV